MTESKTEHKKTETQLYGEFLDAREENLKHKWLMSEQAGQDVGFDKALLDWTVNYRSQWKKDYLKQKSRS